MTKNASKTAEAVILQTKETLQQNVQHKVVNGSEMAFSIGKLVLLGLLLVITGKEITKDSKDIPQIEATKNPTTININNYVLRDDERSNNDV